LRKTKLFYKKVDSEMSSENGVDGNKLTRQKLQHITEENDLEKVEKIAFPLGFKFFILKK